MEITITDLRKIAEEVTHKPHVIAAYDNYKQLKKNDIYARYLKVLQDAFYHYTGCWFNEIKIYGVFVDSDEPISGQPVWDKFYTFCDTRLGSMLNRVQFEAYIKHLNIRDKKIYRTAAGWAVEVSAMEILKKNYFSRYKQSKEKPSIVAFELFVEDRYESKITKGFFNK